MNDGYLGKCKECCKSQNIANREKKIVHYQSYDRQRSKTTHRKLQAIKDQHKRRIRHPNKYKARQMVQNTIRNGKLIKKSCEVCGTSKNVQAHHDDYDKMLEIRWLCFLHHRELHGQKVLVNDSS